MLTLLAQADFALPSGLALLGVVGGLGQLAFWLRWEHRMTRLETKVENLEEKTK